MRKTDIVVLMGITFMIGSFWAGVAGVFHSRRAQAEPIDTYHSSWHRVKDSAAEDAADFASTYNLDGDEGDFASMGSGAFHIRSRGAWGHEGYSPGQQWMFAFYGTDAANETFSFNLVGWAKTNGMLQVICEGNGILGTQDVVTEPNGDSITNGYWADTIALDEQTKWPRYDGALGDPGVGVYNSGDNEVALLVVDLTGLEYIEFVTYDVGGGAEAASLGVYGRRY